MAKETSDQLVLRSTHILEENAHVLWLKAEDNVQEVKKKIMSNLRAPLFQLYQRVFNESFFAVNFGLFCELEKVAIENDVVRVEVEIMTPDFVILFFEVLCGLETCQGGIQ